MSISLGIRPGTHPALLSEVVMPNRTRAPRAERSGSPDFVDANEIAGDIAIGAADGDESNKKEKKEKISRKTEVEMLAEASLPVETRARKPLKSTSLKISLPPLAAAVDPNEPRYCYCNQVSYGEVRLIVARSVTSGFK